MLDFRSKEDGVSTAVEARSHLATLIGDDRRPLKALLPRLATTLGMNPRRVRALWSGEARRIEHDEIMQLRAATIKKQVADARAYADRLESLAYILEAKDSAFHAADIADARAQVCRLRNVAGGTR